MAEKKKNTWIVWTIIGVLIASIVGGVAYAMSWWKDIIFKPDIQTLKSQIPSIIAGLVTNQKVPVSLLVDNPNQLGVTVNDIKVKGSYNGSSIFESDTIPVVKIEGDKLNQKIEGKVNIFANVQSGVLLSSVLAGNQPTIQVTVSLKKFGITKEFGPFDYQIK